MCKCISVAGIIFVMMGTILSLWSVLGTRTKDVGTAAYEDRKQQDFEKNKGLVIIGIVFIISGSALQIVGMYV